MSAEIANVIIQMVGSLGFPIFMCIYLMNYMTKQQTELKDTIADLKTVIVELCTKIEDIKKGEN